VRQKREALFEHFRNIFLKNLLFFSDKIKIRKIEEKNDGLNEKKVYKYIYHI